MEEIIDRYRVLSNNLTWANKRIKSIKSLVASCTYPPDPVAIQRIIEKIEVEKRLINADIDSLAYQVPITQHF